MPVQKRGTYCLVISAGKELEKTIGALGKIHFKPGLYIYMGSALRNMDKRITRHLRRKKKVFWHIDHITADKRFFVEGAYIIDRPQKMECIKAEKMAGIFYGVAGFGSSDCGCRSHLFYAGKDSALSDIDDILTGEMGFSKMGLP